MCGRPYSASYAAFGQEQIRHYMHNKSAHLGYLVVFDGRAKDCGKSLIDQATVDDDTIREIFVDLRTGVGNPNKG